MQRALMITRAGVSRPFLNACEALNAYIYEGLEKLNYAVQAENVPPRPTLPGEQYLPMWSMQTFERLTRMEKFDVAFFCDSAQWVEPLDLFNADKKVVFFHGIISSPLVWMRRDFDLYANSEWTLNVLRSLGGYPDWSNHKLLCPDIFQRSMDVKCPLPALENPTGIGKGDPLPDSFWTALERDNCVYGLDSLHEANDRTHALLMIAINMIARGHGDKRTFRLLVPEGKLLRLQEFVKRLPPTHTAYTALNALGITWRDLYHPFPGYVKQSDFFRLMRLSRFHLAFNQIAESFGLTPLECIMQDCPVFTNGSGNLRHLLPNGCGIHVEDTEGIQDGDFSDYLRVAGRIHEIVIELDHGGVSLIRDALARGQNFIRRQYGANRFFETFSEMLNKPRSAPLSVHNIHLDLSATVRLWNKESGRLLTDGGSHSLELHETRKLEQLLGRFADDIFHHTSLSDQAFISAMWNKGVLTWKPQSG